LPAAEQVIALATSRKLPLLAGSAIAVTWRLPEADIPSGLWLKEALVVVQGRFPQAELDALEALLPLVETRVGGESGLRKVRFLEGAGFWEAGRQGRWSWPLLAAAISRSDSPQGDAVLDGRTQDIVGLGLVPKLAREPRGWVLEHADGLRSSILVLDGVVADYNFAVQASNGQVLSAQLYRPPPPAQHEFSRLAEVIEDFFRTAKAPWTLRRSLLVAELLGTFKEQRPQQGQ
jgi:hypothetical protein